jgi:putative transposase
MLRCRSGRSRGATENAAVCAWLLADLVDRGQGVAGGAVFMIDGGKALSKEIRAAFGQSGEIQRCRPHKERNLLGQVPEADRRLIQPTLR